MALPSWSIPRRTIELDGEAFGARDPPSPSEAGSARREKVVKPSALGMLLRPIGISVGRRASTYALLSLGTTFYRSYYRHLDHTAAVHPDKSVLDIFFPDRSLPPDAVDLIIKDVDGSLHKVIASKSETDKFVNDTILMLDDERHASSRRLTRTSTAPSRSPFRIASKRSIPMPTGSSSGSAPMWC
jgi:hypothetical protein